MFEYKKWLVLLIIIMTSYVLYRLYEKRRAIIATTDGFLGGTSPPQAALEGFTTGGSRDLPLTKYFIKSSYNSCLEKGIISSSLSIAQLERVIMKGYRFLDFELCNIAGEIHVCANDTYGDDSNQNMVNTIKFSDALESIRKLALSAPEKAATGPPNWNEPLFLHLRMKFRTSDSLATFYNSVAQNLAAISQYTNKNHIDFASTPLSAVTSGTLKPCFILVDTTRLSGDSAIPAQSSLNEFINATTSFTSSGDHMLFFYGTTGTTISAAASDKFKIIIPDKQLYSTPYPFDYLKNYGAQIVTQNAALNDYNNIKYNNLFTSGGLGADTGYVEKDYAIRRTLDDLRYNLEDDIKTGVIISVFLLLGVSVLFSIYSS
jgi:Phosphatidylinositol-specific phospholipase C, X domain